LAVSARRPGGARSADSGSGGPIDTRARDWVANALGPVESWPPSLVTALDIKAASRLPVLVLWGPEQSALYNDAFAALLGDRAGAAFGRPLDEVWPALAAELATVIEEVAAGQLPHRESGIVLPGDDRLFDSHLHLSCSALRDQGGEIGGYFVVGEDITSRAQSEQALLAAVVSGSDDAIISKTLDGVIRSWNAGAERIFGYTEEEALGQSIHLIIPEELRDEELTILARLRRGERIEHFETVRVAKDGRRIDISLTVSPVLDKSGHIFGASKVARDVTDRKRAEVALRRSEEQLREADRRKDDFLAMLGHELRNPLAAIRTAIELASRLDFSEPRLDRILAVLERQSVHVGRLVDGLLEVSRIARGKIVLEKRIIDAREVLGAVTHDRQAEIARRGLELVVDLGEDPLWISGDSVRLIQVLDNLISNATKFTDPPGTISVTIERDEESGTISVRDTGAGIAPEMLEHIFEPFHQGPQAIVRSAGGLGLGLALAREIMLLHGGSIEARSPGPGRGAELRVCMPIASPPRHELEPPPTAPTPPRRILIVEDNADAAQMLGALMEMQGHDVSVVGTGGAALDVLRERGADIVLCDLGLPGMTGYELAREIRSDETLRALPLVAVTGYGQPGDRRRTSEAGFDAHLTKPVALEQIGSVLRLLTVDDG
jgi:PAS domain S-box-containing protein